MLQLFAPFFIAAMKSHNRQLSFRRVVAFHVLLMLALTVAASRAETNDEFTTVAYLFLVLGIVEGAALVGWRLTQLPKSQALEFLLTSPIQPRRLFFAEMLTGSARFTLVWLSGVPVVGAALFSGNVDLRDFWVLLFMPFEWGILAAICLTAWVYESRAVRRIGELLALAGVVVYLVVGVVAGEHLKLWLESLPDTIAIAIYQSVVFLHEMNPFGVVRYWFARDRADWVAFERLEYLSFFGFAVIAGASLRAAFRLRGHFHDRHYRPIEDNRAEQTSLIGDRPLSWWAVRRVMEYSGRVNLWMAGGFSVLYAAYIVAGNDWPAWMGRLVFMLFDQWGGAPAVGTAMAVMAAVPAVFQFGLWDPTVQDRCRRLELLLLTNLEAYDYMAAARSAAWRRGRGYLVVGCILWAALAISGINTWGESIAALVGALSLWAFSFAVGFRAFARGNQSNGIASIITIGFPMIVFLCRRLDHGEWANFIPTGLSFTPLRDGVTWEWVIGLSLTLGYSAWLLRRGLARCDADLRMWFDRNQGTKSVE